MAPCGCVAHFQWTENSNNFIVYNTERSKKFKKKTIIFMREKNLLPPRTNFVCNICVDKVETLFSSSSTTVPPLINITTSSTAVAEDTNSGFDESSEEEKSQNNNQKVNDFIEFLESLTSAQVDSVDVNTWSKLLKALGKKVVSQRIVSDGTLCSKFYKLVDFLSTIDVDTYVKSRDNLLKSFVEGVTQKTYENLPASGKLKFAYTLENIYGLENFNWVLPISFSSNFIQSVISGSKTVTEMNGKLSPGGGYSTFLKWFTENGKIPLESPSGDIVTFFDNIGKYIYKLYQISKNKAPTADIITTTLHLVLEDKVCLILNL